jgi:pimeloyl-ACP methyl ester carboxylesterase
MLDPPSREFDGNFALTAACAGRPIQPRFSGVFRGMNVRRILELARGYAREQALVAALGVPALLRHPAWRVADPTLGRGAGVLLVPGFGVGDIGLAHTGKWLAARGYRPASAGIGLDVGCTSALVDQIEDRLAAHAEATGGKVVLFGQSRGGALARLTAVRRPDLVRGLVMLGSPVLDMLGARLGVLTMARLLARLSALGVRGLLDDDCFRGDCYTVNSQALRAALPAEVPAVAFYSRNDAIAPWHLCLDPYATCVEVASTHTGMAFDPAVYTALGPLLATWTDQVRQPLAG